MARKPSDVVSPNLRIREGLRRRLERKAKQNAVSLNAEMTARLEHSLDQEAIQSIDSVASHIEGAWARMAEAHHDRNVQGDLLRASEALLKQIDAEDCSEATKAAADKVRKVIKMIELEAAQALRSMHTTGGDQ